MRTGYSSQVVVDLSIREGGPTLGTFDRCTFSLSCSPVFVSTGPSGLLSLVSKTLFRFMILLLYFRRRPQCTLLDQLYTTEGWLVHDDWVRVL